MKDNKNIHKILTWCIAAVWIINGLFCKLFNLVPRHQLIVSRILGDQYAYFFTKTIGVLEICMSVWILSSIVPRLCAVTQILVVLTMNIIEFTLVPDLLLFGKLNLLIAILFVLLIYYTEFVLRKSFGK